jgi:hypothetical protein
MWNARRERFYRECVERARESGLYRSLIAQRLHTPSGYLSYALAALRAATAVHVGELSNQEALQDDNFLTTALLTKLLADNQAPVYWISKSLCEALLATDVPPHVFGMHRPIPWGWLMLPKNLLKSPEGPDVEFLQFHHHLATDSEMSVNIGRRNIPVEQGQDFVAWSTILSGSSSIIYTGTFNISPEKTELEDSAVDLSYAWPGDDPEAEGAFTDKVGKLLLKVLLVLQAKPDLLTQERALGFGQITFNGKKPQKPATDLWTPNWIGKNYRPPFERITPQGTHASPRTHWRRGHLKKVVVGNREEGKRKVVWIEPTLVNA